MIAPQPNHVSSLLLQLYRLAHELPIDVFQDAALDLVRPVLAFDSSMWGTATTAVEGIDVRTLHLHRKSPEMMIEYEEHKHLDTAAAHFFGKGHGTRGFNSATWWGSNLDKPFLDYVQRYDQNNIFITMDSDPRTNFMQWISLFRADSDDYCLPEEERLLADLSPHLMQALALNRVMHLEKDAPEFTPKRQRGNAICDLHGTIYHCDVTFITLLQHEYCGWSRKALPKPLLDHFMAAQSRYVGNEIAMTYKLEQRLLFLSVRPRCRVDGLAPREYTVAQLLARGSTHKDIALILDRSPSTVRNQIQSIYEKLQVNNVAGLICEMQLAS